MQKRVKFGARDMAYCALMSVLIAVCSWISVPLGPVPFTLQTLGVFCALGLLGGARGMVSILVYIMLGLIGLPVFAGFTAGPGALMGSSGGYILGFALTGIIYWLVTAKSCKAVRMAIGMSLGLVGCYAFGTAWFMAVYAQNTGPVGLGAALGWCVFPFIIPDACKIALAMLLARRLKRYVRM